VLREAVASGVDHIDTSDYYGPHHTNHLIRDALHSYPDDLARDGIGYAPFFPLGGFTPLLSTALTEVAKGLGAIPMQVALARLLRRAPNILLIPGTSSIGHLRENLAAANLELPRETAAPLDQIAAGLARPEARLAQ
jgi:aryl-alcohol dehydrogenase-like predicted oxidoreductase